MTWTANPSFTVFADPRNDTLPPLNWALLLAKTVNARAPSYK